MSASREKKKRQSPEGLSRKQQAAQEAAKKEKKYKLTAAVVSIAVVVFIAFSLYIGLYLPRHAPRTKAALEIGEHKITAAEMNFYYMDGVYAFLNQNSSFLSYLLDTSVPLDQQYYDEENGVTWADYFLDEAAKTAATYYAMYDDAVAAGQGLTEEQSASIDADLESMKETLSTNDAYTGFNNYLEQSYGKGCDEATYRHYLEVQTVAEAWSTAYEDSLTYSDEEVESAYQADPNRYTSVTYRSFYMSKSYFEEELADDATEEEQAAADAAALEAAKAQAEAMAEACKGDEAAFAQWARDNAPEGSQDTYADDDTTLSREISYENASSYGRDWFYDSARQPGDTACFAAGETGYYVYYFVGTGDNRYDTANIRRIYVGVTNDTDADGDGSNDSVSDALWASAEERAKGLMEEWESGEKTEDSFANIASVNSADMTSTSSGGLLENVAHYDLEDPVNDWIFDASRKSGDCELIKSETGYQDGWYLVYYIGPGEDRRDNMIRSDLKEDDYTAWYTGYQEKYEPVLLEGGLKYVNTDVAFNSGS